jgi:hypothetical protein
MRQQFRQMRSQIQQIHGAERAQILGALTPAHRSLLATIAGRLATSANPDFQSAAQQLDSALSGGEKQAIINASENARNKMRSLMSQMRPEGPMGMRAPHGNRTPDAGRILLRTAMSPGPGMMMDHPPMMHP